MPRTLHRHVDGIGRGEHPFRFGSGFGTTATGVLTGTFGPPMLIGLGKTIPASGKAVALGAMTMGHWSNGKMDHDWLFWGNGDFMQQIGLGP